MISSVVSRKTDLKPWVNLVSVKSKVVNKVAVQSTLFSAEWTRPHKLVLRADHVTVSLHFTATLQELFLLVLVSYKNHTVLHLESHIFLQWC
jgi:hypothetical protein